MPEPHPRKKQESSHCPRFMFGGESVIWLSFIIMAIGNSFHRMGPSFERSRFGFPLMVLGFVSLIMLPDELSERGIELHALIQQSTLDSHAGSIIRINLDGSIPKDNPRFINKKNWLPEIFQIGIRNPQGMTLSPFDNKIYISNHGAMGGDFIGAINHSGNYGWKKIGWGFFNGFPS